jgi:hypothetical protein
MTSFLPSLSRSAFVCQEDFSAIIKRQDCFRQSQILEHESCSGLKPFHIHAEFYGQGFGRIIEHTVTGCLFAQVVLGRPCTINMDCRDTFLTWRSFINSGALNWDWNVATEQQKSSIQLTIEDLPNPQADEWSTRQQAKSEMRGYSQALPMIWNSNLTLAQNIDAWRKKEPNQIIVSPNWGSAWYRHVPVAVEINTRLLAGCKMNPLRTLVQNQMYFPTNLAMQLHHERKEKVLGSNTKVYGAIHLRTVLSDATFRMDYISKDIVNMLNKCIGKAMNILADDKRIAIKNWWLISDNKTVASFMKEECFISKEHTILIDQNATFWETNTHSGFAMKHKFFHDKLAPSIEDFMVLHESSVAIATHGSFGSTGARGRGKIKRQECGRGNLFSIYA